MIKEVTTANGNPFSKRVEYVINDMCVGYLEYSVIYDRIEIDNINVIEEYRKMGIGTKLMTYLIDMAIELDVVNITLEVRVSNEVAKKLYKKFGFKEEAIRKYYYGDEDGILMRKQIK